MYFMNKWLAIEWFNRLVDNKIIADIDRIKRDHLKYDIFERFKYLKPVDKKCLQESLQ